MQCHGFSFRPERDHCISDTHDYRYVGVCFNLSTDVKDHPARVHGDIDSSVYRTADSHANLDADHRQQRYSSIAVTDSGALFFCSSLSASGSLTRA